MEIAVIDRAVLDAPELGVEAVSALLKLYPGTFEIDGIERLLLNKPIFDRIKAGEDPRAVAAGWQADLENFKVKRQKYLLYP